MDDAIKQSLMSAAQGMNAQSKRLRVVSENIANADTHGYQRKMVMFENVYQSNSDATRLLASDTFLDTAPQRQIFEPSNPLADENGYVALSNVNVMIEVADARDANQTYEANTTVFREARRMYGNLLDILRR